MEFEAPRGYRLHTPDEGDWELTRETDGFTFNITNREFEPIDGQFNHLISQTIEKLIESQPKVRVLDIAGGIGSYAANDIAERFGNSVAVYNADILSHSWNYNDNLSPVRADASHLPFQNNSIDLVYSYSFLPYFRISKAYQDEYCVLKEMKRVLKPKRTAILEELYISYMNSKDIKKVEDELGVDIDLAKRHLPLSARFKYFLYSPLTSPKFLVMTKPAK